MYAVYQVLVKPGMGLNEVIRITGTFPKARYFSVRHKKWTNGLTKTAHKIQRLPGAIHTYTHHTIAPPQHQNPAFSLMYCKCPQIQSNNPKLGMPITTLRDYEVVADAGSKNPFSNTTATDGGTGTFTVYITSRPSKK
jgi:hypothetical protein